MINKIAIDKINAEVADYFAVKPIELNIIEHDKTSLDKAWIDGRNEDIDGAAPIWLVGFTTKSQKVNILSAEAMPPAGRMTGEQRFMKTLKHEIVHIYIRSLNKNIARWLNEGIAQHVAGQNMYEKIDIRKLKLCEIVELHKGSTNLQTYKIGKNIVDEIVGRFGNSKVLSLITLNKKELYIELKKMFGWLK